MKSRKKTNRHQWYVYDKSDVTECHLFYHSQAEIELMEYLNIDFICILQFHSDDDIWSQKHHGKWGAVSNCSDIECNSRTFIF